MKFGGQKSSINSNAQRSSIALVESRFFFSFFSFSAVQGAGRAMI